MNAQRMPIQEIFLKEIDRKIAGVIKVGQDNKKQELEEYVVTNELRRHFLEFFSNYAGSITTPTDEMGVWISGFFGSGKSHLLKILSYILDNPEVDGKPAMDYLREKEDLQGETMLLANMELAGRTPTEAILFNVDSKSAAAAKSDSNAIVMVFNRVFNEKLGYDGANPALADLERELDHDGKYQEFKDAYREITGKDWLQERNKLKVRRGQIEKTLVKIGYMTMENAQIWTKESTTQAYQIAIEDFAERVRQYIEESGKRVVFLVDEIGQFIASDSNLMLNLQTMVEELGTRCRGKAWVIVTAQEDIDSMTDNMRERKNDFSKIQGRFGTRLSLSSVNADEVIKKRILKKNRVGTATLTALYDTEETGIKSKVEFKTPMEMKKIENVQDFVDNYPFLPYQFHLLADVLNAIRLNSSTGKHLSEGERSMLGAYQQAAEQVMRDNVGTLVPFYRFYDDLVKFLDHTHSVVIQRAENNKHLNPLGESDCFTVNVLKTLFLLKYVKGIDLTVGNIVSLMVTDVHEDRIRLRNKVEEALVLLKNELLIQQVQDTYEFLTDEEQDINREIAQRNISQADVIHEATRRIFDDIYSNTRYKVPKFNGRYTYAYNQTVDGHPAKSGQNNEIGLHIITPKYTGQNGRTNINEQTVSFMSSTSRDVILLLPENNLTWYDELLNSLKINDYLRNVADPGKGKSTMIRAAKMQEALRNDEEALKSLKEAIGNAMIFMGGHKVTEITTHDPSVRINEALGRLVESIYYKLSYMNSPKDDQDIRVLFKPKQGIQLTTGDLEAENSNALKEMKDQISLLTAGHAQVSLKSLVDLLSKQPFGYLESDVRWLAAKLFQDGKISVTVDKEPVTLFNTSPDDLATYFTNKKFLERMLIREKEIIKQDQIAAAKNVISLLFHKTETTSDPDKLIADFKAKAADTITECKDILKEIQFGDRGLPGREAAEKTVKTLTELSAVTDTGVFFKRIKESEEDLKELANEVAPVRNFYASDSLKNIFKSNGLNALKYYDDSKEHITDEELAEIIEQIRTIIKNKAPYAEIKYLPQLYKKYRERYSRILDERLEPVKSHIEEDKQNVLTALKGKPFEEHHKKQVITAFDDLTDRATAEKNISNLLGFRDKADSLCENWLTLISNLDQVLASIAYRMDTVITALKGKAYEEQFRGEAQEAFLQLLGKAGEATNKSTISSLDTKAEELKKEYLARFKELDGNKVDYDPVPAPPEQVVKEPVRRPVKVLMARHLSSQWVITSEEQLDERLDAFKKKILEELNNGNDVKVQF